ncbi:hypothetical protein [Ilumatobacter coccineus]|uniref:Uncharacterized protein n=1 Tax=Ilumatobacter coccineus (strain NBRC 103263 / KCTC 29153 / YM16-304) TaxID=1313172 RepID=A0A6C7EKQ3_ILUCY|nr:hypothetical protein [Ilumatobacter coccineus]BAN04516.1 hypothetical protein YM304_42020 [Ilumatobacter coccineus YM16-304]
MGRLDDIGEQDGWRCWLCDEPVDADRSVNDDRGPSVDSRMTDRKAKSKGKKKGAAELTERLAHRSCNTGKGNVDAVVPWAEHLFVVDPSPIIPSVERLANKGGREVMARCPTRSDAQEAADWLIDRISRLEPSLDVRSDIDEGGGQFLVALRA